MTLRQLFLLPSLVLLLALSGCSTPSGQGTETTRAEVRIKGVTIDRLQDIILRHMSALGYKQKAADRGFLALEQSSGGQAPGVPGSTEYTSKIQIALQEVETNVLGVYAVEYITYKLGNKIVEKQAPDPIYMQGLLEGFKAKALYGEPKPAR